MKLLLIILSITVINTTNKSELTDFVETGLNILSVESTVYVVETPNHNMGNRNYVTKINDSYYIYVDTSERKSRVYRALAHEMIHISQYESGKLVVKSDNEVLWDDKPYYLDVTPHSQRPWEVKAKKDEYSLQKVIEKYLR